MDFKSGWVIFDITVANGLLGASSLSVSQSSTNPTIEIGKLTYTTVKYFFCRQTTEEEEEEQRNADDSEWIS